MLVEQLIARRANTRLLSAADATAGIALARLHQPEVILMDINLPGISGIRALKLLREDPLTRHIPVIAISANAMPHDVRRGLEAGFFSYLTKPIRVDAFMAAMDVALEASKVARASARSTGSPAMISDSDILNGRILIVDDLAANVRLLEQMLRGAGYINIDSTMDPHTVCAMHVENHYDLILLDLLMPGMDGFAVLEQLKAIEANRYVPVLVITAQPGHKLRALQAGAKDFISKPIDLTEAKARIHNMLEVRLLYRQVELHNQLLERTVLERTAELRATEERFHRLTELSSDWYWEQDAGGKYTEVSGPALEMLGIGGEPCGANPDAPSWKRTSPHDVRSSTWSTAGRALTVRCSISRSVASPSSASPAATLATAGSAWTSHTGSRTTDRSGARRRPHCG